MKKKKKVFKYVLLYLIFEPLFILACWYILNNCITTI